MWSASQRTQSGGLDCTSDVSQTYQLQEAETVASPQVTVVKQPEILGRVDLTSAVSQQYRYLTSERDTVGIAQVQSDLNKLSAEAAVEHSSRKSDRITLLCRLYVVKTARDQIGPHINGCANLSNLSSH